MIIRKLPIRPLNHQRLQTIIRKTNDADDVVHKNKNDNFNTFELFVVGLTVCVCVYALYKAYKIWKYY